MNYKIIPRGKGITGELDFTHCSLCDLDVLRGICVYKPTWEKTITFCHRCLKKLYDASVENKCETRGGEWDDIDVLF